MTSETFLDITFDQTSKNGKRQLKPRLLKLTDAAIPRRNRKKTKTKTKERSVSSVRDRIFDDPAYTDDISHLANPLRPRSNERRSSNIEIKSNLLDIPTSGVSGGSLGKRSKLTKEFLLYNKQQQQQHLRGTQDFGAGSGSGGDGVESQGHDDGTSSSDEHSNMDQRTRIDSLVRRGRSLDRNVLEKSEKRRERAALAAAANNNYQQQHRQATGQDKSKERFCQDLPPRKFKNEKLDKSSWNDQSLDADVASTSTASGEKMHLGRRFLRGEIGIKSFNYYLLKEGLKSSKRLVGKQRNPAVVALTVGEKQKKHSRSEENIYEEIFFKNASASDEENQNNSNVISIGKDQMSEQPQLLQQLGVPLTAEVTPKNIANQSIGTDTNVFANCDLCMQHCSKENCDYCFSLEIDTPTSIHHTADLNNAQLGGTEFSLATQADKCDTLRRGQGGHLATTGLYNKASDNGNNNVPAAHILEFQSYNPNNPGVYKIETTPVAITGEYNPMLQFQQPPQPTMPVGIGLGVGDRQQTYAQAKVYASRQFGHDNTGLKSVPLQAAHCYQGNIFPLIATQSRHRSQRFVSGYQQPYLLKCNGGIGPSVSTINAKSSSSSDSLQQKNPQQQHKFNTVARMEANVLYGDPFYGGSTNGLVHMHPLIYASSRPIGGSQILLDPYDQSPHMYKSDSRASILSEYSLRSSDNSHRYGRFLHHRSAGARGEVSDSSLGDSLFSCASTQRRYFGSTESCRFGFECRRCSLDNGAVGVGIGIGLGLSSTGGGGGGIGQKFIGGNGSGCEKCSFSDTCRYDCRNCDCSSSYFSSDFDDYGHANSSNIPRKTAAGILPSNIPTTQSCDVVKNLEEQLDRKQNKYARDFFKHVNDVKRSIYQSEMQRNGSLETNSSRLKPKQYSSDNPEQTNKDQTGAISKPNDMCTTLYTTLPLTKDRQRLENASILAKGEASDTNLNKLTPFAAQRNSLHSKATQQRQDEIEKDRGNTNGTGAIPKVTTFSTKSHIAAPYVKSPKTQQTNPINTSEKKMATDVLIEATNESSTSQTLQSPKLNEPPSEKQSSIKSFNTNNNTKQEHFLNVSSGEATLGVFETGSVPLKRHHRSSSSKASSSGTGSRRRDTPAAPPPSPATYSDLQELQANLESMQDDTKSPKRAKGIDSPLLVTESDREHDASSKTKQLPKSLSTSQQTLNKDQNNTSVKLKKSFLENKYNAAITLDNEEDDIFYDARSEDSGCKASTAASQINKNLTTDDPSALKVNQLNQKQTPQQKLKIKGKGRHQRTHDNLEMLSTKRKEKKNNKNDNNNEDKDEEVQIITTSPTTTTKTTCMQNESVMIESQSNRDNGNNDNETTATIKATISSPKTIKPIINGGNNYDFDEGDGDYIVAANNIYVKTDDIQQKTTSTASKKVSTKQKQQEQTMTQTMTMALNSAESNEASTTTTTRSKKASASKLSSSASRRPGERRSKSSNTTRHTSHSSNMPAICYNQQAAITTTISCDTCCKLECNERSKKEVQQPASPSSSISTLKANNNGNRTWRLKAESSETTTITAINPNNNESSSQTNERVLQQQNQHQQQKQQQQHQADTDSIKCDANEIVCPKTALNVTCADKKQQPSTTIVETPSPSPSGTATVTTKARTINTIISNTLTTIASVDDTKINFQNAKQAEVVESQPATSATPAVTISTPTANEASQLVAATKNADSSPSDTATQNVTTLATSPTTTTPTNENAATEERDSERKAVAATAAAAGKLESPNSFAISCNSDSAGVTTSPHSATNVHSTTACKDGNYETAIQIPSTTLIPSSTSTGTVNNGTKSHRHTLQRQDNSCVDSSEAQSDDSHLTRDSITRESQNDELSSSTLDKIDLSILPLPALPPKKRRTRSRVSPSKYHRSRHETAESTHINEHAAAQKHSNAVASAAVTTTAQVDDNTTTTETQQLSAFQQYVAKRRESLEASARCFDEKLEARNRMHYHMTGSTGISGVAADAANASSQMPTYLFGEKFCGNRGGFIRKFQPDSAASPQAREEIFLNKSGWVQVNTKRGYNDSRSGSYRHFLQQNGKANSCADMRYATRVIKINDGSPQRADMPAPERGKGLPHQQRSIVTDSNGYAVPHFIVSKVDNHVLRNPQLRPGYRIVDSHVATILNERPGFLPVRNAGDADSPPPITPILSPPPAFQDSSSKLKGMEKRNTNNSPLIQQSTDLPPGIYTGVDYRNAAAVGTNSNNKGMVFSRSFEYDMRRSVPEDTYVETFSRSFDGNLSERPIVSIKRDRSPNFSSLTGNSPNYLTKKDSGGGSSGSLRSRDSSPKYQQPRTTAYMNTSVKEAPPAYSTAVSSRHSPRTRRERSFERARAQNTGSRSRKSQFSRTSSSGPIRLAEKPHTSLVSRFRSFDTTVSQRLNSCDSGARSDLSNDELDNEDDPTGSAEFLTVNYHHSVSPIKKQRERSPTPDRNESRSSSGSFRKQRSLTPESRSLTPEDRRTRGSEASLVGIRGSNGGSRSSTLEHKSPLSRHEDKTPPYISRSSSSSSYSASREHEPQGNINQNNQQITTGISTIGLTAQHRRSLGRSTKPSPDEYRIRRSRSLQLSERAPNRAHNIYACIRPPALTKMPTSTYQQQLQQQQQHHQPTNEILNTSAQINLLSNKTTPQGKSQQPLVQNLQSGGESNFDGIHHGSGNRIRNTDMDKSRSFDFDYIYYKPSASGADGGSGSTGTANSESNSNQNVPLRIDFDKSRSFDDDYKEAVTTTKSMRHGNTAHLRYLQANDSGNAVGAGGGVRYRKALPANTAERNSCALQQQISGSPCNNMRLQRQTTSPQNYGTRLCDHELTYDKLRKSLDRSPIMDFCQSSNEYETSTAAAVFQRGSNRETINSGGNTELNFMNIYETPVARTKTAGGMKQRSTIESPYATTDLNNDTSGNYCYRQTGGGGGGHQHQSSRDSRSSGNLGSVRRENTHKSKHLPVQMSTNSLRNAYANANAPDIMSKTCSFGLTCGSCRAFNTPSKTTKTSLRPSASFSATTTTTARIPPHHTTQTKKSSTMHERFQNLRDNNFSARGSLKRNKSPWRLLCSGVKPSPSPSSSSATISTVSSYIEAPLRSSEVATTTPALICHVDDKVSVTVKGDNFQPLSNRTNKNENFISQTEIKFAPTQTIKVNQNENKNESDYLLSNDTKANLVLVQAATVKGPPLNSNKKRTLNYHQSRQKANKFKFLSVSLPDLTDVQSEAENACEKRGRSESLKVRAVSTPALIDPLLVQVTEVGNVAECSDSNFALVKTKRPKSYPNVSVLQKFKRTFGGLSKLQQQQTQVQQTEQNTTISSTTTTTTIAVAPIVEGTKHFSIIDAANGNGNGKTRFGSLIWRSSKERRSTKGNRNGKCYSSDSGIQIELESDERGIMTSGKNISQLQNAAATEPHAHVECKTEGGDLYASPTAQTELDIIPTMLDNGEKCTTSGTIKSSKSSPRFFTDTNTDIYRLIECDINKERLAPASLPSRSISQPQGLDICGTTQPGCDDSEMNSVGSKHSPDSHFQTTYAEVVHDFTAVGPQELGLERGSIVEVLRKEAGPWWFGRLKHIEDNIVEEILDLELGWFPKDFVHVVKEPQINEYLRAVTQQQSRQTSRIVNNSQQQQQPTIMTATADELQKELTANAAVKNNERFSSTTTTASDVNNVTTIVVNSPTSDASKATATAASSSVAALNILPYQDNLILRSSNVLRLSAVRELLTTEVNYVKLLTSICEGYLPAMSKRIDIFAPNSIRLIFSNITAIYGFQLQFLSELRKGIEQDQIAKIFLKIHKGFLCYSTYCNSYPRALIELESYDRIREARIIWENCREAENLTEFPLAAHLLSPVQRICRYPLHLGELLKMTAKSSDENCSYEEMKLKLEQLDQNDASLVDLPDSYRAIEMALEAMKGITEAVNEGKRHSETISRHQSNFQNFKGPPLHLHSTRFFAQIDATRQKQNLWNSSCTLFLFDNQLIYCKRDIIKRSQFIYKGRIFIDRCRVVNVRDGKMFGQTIKNALRIYCEARDKWYDFSFRSANRKQKFLHTLALERQFGGKALYVSEMTGFDYALRERNTTVATSGGITSGCAEYSDQSDFEFSETDYCYARPPPPTPASRDYLQDVSSGSGNSSVPQSPTKKTQGSGNSLTLPKKSKSGDNFGLYNETQTSSLRRGRIGNWFRRPKSTNSTPNLSPTHKPILPVPLIAQSKQLQLEVINKLGSGNDKVNVNGNGHGNGNGKNGVEA